MEKTKKVSTTEARIRESLLEQLARYGKVSPDAADLVEQYIFMYKQVREMKANIKKSGREYETTSAAGKPYIKENPDVKNIILYNRQMLAIRKQLGLDEEGNEPVEDDEL